MRPVRINGSVTFVRHVGDRRAFLDARCPHGHPPLSLEAAFVAASFLSDGSAMIARLPIWGTRRWYYALP
jgi:hypothetical protein